MDDKQILAIVHQTAAEMTAEKDGEAAGHGAAVSTEGTDSLIDGYGFSSIDALKFLLVLEEKFGITLADEDLNEEALSSATALAKRIASLRQRLGSPMPGHHRLICAPQWRATSAQCRFASEPPPRRTPSSPHEEADELHIPGTAGCSRYMAAYSPPTPLVFVTAAAKAASMLSLDAAGPTKAAKQG